MAKQKDKIIKLLVVFVLVVLTFFVVKEYMIPILPEFSLVNILALPMFDLVKVFETVVVIIFLTGFVLQELFEALANILFCEYGHLVTNNSIRWSNLVYIFVLIFGSASLYVGVSNIAGW